MENYRGRPVCSAALILCAVWATGCSSKSLSSVRDAAPGGFTGSGGVTGAGGTTAPAVGGAPGTVGVPAGTGGMTGTGGATTGPLLDGSVANGGGGGVSTTGGGGGSGGIASAGGRVGGVGGVSGTGGSTAGGIVDGGSQLDSGIDAAMDAPAGNLDARLADLPSSFEMGGIWLVGWSGDLRHYSWVRMSTSPGGTAEYLSGADLPSNSPFWSCSGQGTWFPTEAPYAIMLRFPASCPSTLPGYFTFRNALDLATCPPGATFGMLAAGNGTVQPQSEWWRFPDDQCDAKMTACKSPF